MSSFIPQPLYEASAITSMRDPQGNNSTLTIPQINPKLIWLEPDVAPFVSIMENKVKKSGPVRDFVHKWYKKYPYPMTVQASGAQVAGDTTIDLKAGDGAKIALDWSIMNLRTEEIMRVSAAPSTDTVTFIRGIGDYGPFDINDGDKFLILGNTKEDGSGMAALRSTGQREEYNYPEITANAFGLTGRMLQTERWTGADMEEAQREAWHEHAKALERKMLWGLRDRRLGTLGNGQNSMGGLRQFIKRNVWDLDGKNITKTSFDDFCVEAGKYGGGGYLHGSATKGVFCGRALAQVFIDMAEDKVRYSPNDRVLGMDVHRVINASGTWNIFKCGTFDVVPELANQAFIIDINEVEARPFAGRSTALQSDLQANDIDGRKFQFFTDQTLEVPMEEAHARIINVGL